MKHLVCILTLATTAVASAEPWVRHTIDDSSRGADGVRLADVNGDSLPDIATGWEEGGQIRVYLNPGPQRAASKWPAVTVGAVKSPEDAVLVDLDGDGAMDVVSSCEGRNRTAFVHWAPREKDRFLDERAWTTSPFPATQARQSWMFAIPMQMDGRNGIDLVLGSKGNGASISWLQSPDDPRDLNAWKLHQLTAAGWIMSLQSHDLDRDGDPDILASDRKGSRRNVLWLENPGTTATAAGAVWNVHGIGPADREFMFLALGDLHGDKSTNILCTVRGGGISLLSPSSNHGWAHHEIAMPKNCGTGKGVAIGDLDGDRQPDLVFTCENATGDKSGVRWMAWQGSPTSGLWSDHEISGPVGIKFDRVELLDLDGDGDLDVLTCEERNNLGVFWYENPSR